MWYDFLRNYPVRFLRQKVIDQYIVDFYCHEARLIVELDGSQHYEEDGMAYDAQRTAYLNAQGLKVLRFANTDIWKNFAGVCEKIDTEVSSRLG